MSEAVTPTIDAEALTKLIWSEIDNPALRYREVVKAAEAVMAALLTERIAACPEHVWRHGGNITEADECIRCGGRYLHTISEGCRDTGKVKDSRAEAKRRFPNPIWDTGFDMLPEYQRAAFIAGAEWREGR